VAARRHPKDVLEMLGDFFREAAVLLLIFYPLEMARTNNGSLSLPFILIVVSCSPLKLDTSVR
jgi:hypothetical protein